MRRIVTRGLAALAASVGAVALLAGPVGAHPMDPPGEANGAPGALPMSGDNPGHRGVQCAAEGGHPVFPSLAGVFECPASD